MPAAKWILLVLVINDGVARMDNIMATFVRIKRMAPSVQIRATALAMYAHLVHQPN
jgi:hypothetical protein